MDERIERTERESDGRPTVSRRAFVAGATAAGAAVAASAGLTLTGCGPGSRKGDAPTALTATANDVVTVKDTFTESEQEDHVLASNEYSHPMGTLFFASAADFAATLMPGETSRPLMSAGITSLTTGAYTELLHDAVSAGEGFSIFNVRASASLMVWTELNYLTGQWRLYCAPLRGADLGVETKLAEGDSDYDPALIAVSDATAIWVVQPSETGTKTTETTYVYSSASGGAATVICESHGRLATEPHVVNGTLVITPRVDTSGVYYKMLACNPATGAEIASAVLPSSQRPLDVVWTGNAFAWSIEAAYESGGSIGNYGVYLQQGNRFLRLGGIPQDGPVVVGANLVCKIGAQLTVLDTARQQYFTIKLPSGCADYGDCFATDGAGTRLACYTTVSELADRSDAKVLLRVIELN